MLPAPQDCVVSEDGLGKYGPDDPGSALRPFLQKMGSKLHLN